MSLITATLCILISGCGVVANRTPIPAGLPTATMHFGPKHGGLLTQSIHLNDGEFCHPAQFSRFKIIGAYLGSEVDVPIPASQTLFVSLTERAPDRCRIGAGMCTIECATGVSFSPVPGASYIARMERQADQCRIVVNKINGGVEEEVATKPELERCLY